MVTWCNYSMNVIRTRPWVKAMTHPCFMDNCVKYYADATWQWGVIAKSQILGMFALWPWHWMYDLRSRSDTLLGHGQQLCEIILSRSNMTVRSYGPDTDFRYVCTMTLTLVIWPWVKAMTHPWIMDNKCVIYNLDPTWQWGVMAQTLLWPWPWRYDLGSRSWHTLGSRTLDNNMK